jgi:hypothetical protein
MLSWKLLCYVAHLVLIDLAAQNCLSGSCKFPFVICAYSLSSPPPHATATAVAPTGNLFRSMCGTVSEEPPKDEFFNRAAHNTAMRKQVGCRGKGREGEGCWPWWLAVWDSSSRGVSAAEPGFVQLDVLLSCPFPRFFLDVSQLGEGNKKHIFDDCRTAPVWPCVRGPPRILFLLVAVDGPPL